MILCTNNIIYNTIKPKPKKVYAKKQLQLTTYKLWYDNLKNDTKKFKWELIYYFINKNLKSNNIFNLFIMFNV